MLTLNFNPFPELETDRLLLRPLTAADAPALFAIRDDESINKYLGNFRHQSIQQTLDFIKKIEDNITGNEAVLWALSPKNSLQLMGTICLWNISKENHTAETGYILHPAFQKKGFMQEALLKVIDYGFNTLHLNTLEAYTHYKNDASSMLLEKCGFTRGVTIQDEDENVIYTLKRGV